jgi:hypothetical protein
MIGGVSSSSSKSSESMEDGAVTLWIDTANLFGRELVPQTAVTEVPSIEGAGKASKEGK